MAEPLSLSELRQIARRRVLYFIIPAVLVWVVGAVLAYSLPSVYQSTGVILVEAQEIPEDLVRSTVTGFAERRIQVINQRVMSSANLRRIVDRFDLYAAERSQMPISAVLDRFRSDVSLSTISAEVSDRAESATIAFEVTYESTDPGIAQRVANELTSLYLSENLRTRTAAAAETSEFLTEEARRLAERMQQLGARIAEFKQAHQGNLPEQADLNAQLLRSTEQSIGELRRRIETVQERQVFLNAELAQVEPHRPVYDERGQVLQSPEQKLRALEASLASLRARYGESHPDVRRAEREAQALRAQVGDVSGVAGIREQLELREDELLQARQRYTEGHPDITRLEREVAGLREALAQAPPSRSREPSAGEPDNPAYIQIRTQVQAAEGEIAAIRRQIANLQQRREELQERLLALPQVEQEYRGLAGELEQTERRYREVRDKQMQAQVSESMERERMGERFSLIEPPERPAEPAKPNRKVIVALGFFAGLVFGAAIAMVRELLDQTLHGPRRVSAVLGAPPLVSVPLIHTREDQRRRRRRRYGVAGGALAVAVVVLVCVHLFVVPLDVLGPRVQQRIGIL